MLNFCSNLSFLSIRNGCCVSTMRMNHTGMHRDAKCHNLENEERKNLRKNYSYSQCFKHHSFPTISMLYTDSIS